MAKGQVTEKDLELGLKKAGGFSGLSKKTRRDSPFGQEHAKPVCLLYTSPSPRDRTRSRMPSSA